jgi:hypothetical protein
MPYTEDKHATKNAAQLKILSLYFAAANQSLQATQTS